MLSNRNGLKKDMKVQEPNRLKEIRESLKLTQQELADLVGTTQAQIGRLEKGQRDLSQHWMSVLAKALKIEPWALFIESKPLIGPRDREILSRYHTLPDRLRSIVDTILFGDDRSG